MPQTEAAAPKRTRTVKKAEYRVEVLQASPQDRPDEWTEVEGADPADTASGLKWIRETGEAGRTYRVVRVCAGPVEVKVENKPVRKLV